MKLLVALMVALSLQYHSPSAAESSAPQKFGWKNLTAGIVKDSSAKWHYQLPIDVPQDRAPLLINIIPEYRNDGTSSIIWGQGWSDTFSIKFNSNRNVYEGHWGSFIKGNDDYWYNKSGNEFRRLKIVNHDLLIEDQNGNIFNYKQLNTVSNYQLVSASNRVGQSSVVQYENINNSARPKTIYYGKVGEQYQYQININYPSNQHIEVLFLVREQNTFTPRKKYSFDENNFSLYMLSSTQQKAWSVSWNLNALNDFNSISDSFGNKTRIEYSSIDKSLTQVCETIPGETFSVQSLEVCSKYQFTSPLYNTEGQLIGHQQITTHRENASHTKIFKNIGNEVILLRESTIDLNTPHITFQQEYLYELGQSPFSFHRLSNHTTFFENGNDEKASMIEKEFQYQDFCPINIREKNATGTLTYYIKNFPGFPFSCIPYYKKTVGSHYDKTMDFDFTEQWSIDEQTGLILNLKNDNTLVYENEYDSHFQYRISHFKEIDKTTIYDYHVNGLIKGKNITGKPQRIQTYYPVTDLPFQEFAIDEAQVLVETIEYDSIERPKKSSQGKRWEYFPPSEKSPGIQQEWIEHQGRLSATSKIFSSSGNIIGESYQDESGHRIRNFYFENKNTREVFKVEDFAIIGNKLNYHNLYSWARMNQIQSTRTGLFLPFTKQFKIGNDKPSRRMIDINSGFIYVQDQSGNTEVLDANRNIIKQIKSDKQNKIYLYDLLNRIRKSEGPLAQTEEWTYDSLNRVTLYKKNGKPIILKEYGKNGLLYRHKYKDGRHDLVLSYGYDKEKRIHEVNIRNEKNMQVETKRFYYDGKNCLGKQISKSQLGRLTSICSNTSDKSFIYDSQGNLLKRISTIQSKTSIETFNYGPSEQILHYQFEDFQEKIQIDYHYDANMALAHISLGKEIILAMSKDQTNQQTLVSTYQNGKIETTASVNPKEGHIRSEFDFHSLISPLQFDWGGYDQTNDAIIAVHYSQIHLADLYKTSQKRIPVISSEIPKSNLTIGDYKYLFHPLTQY